jgi:hypothetical protein
MYDSMAVIWIRSGKSWYGTAREPMNDFSELSFWTFALSFICWSPNTQEQSRENGDFEITTDEAAGALAQWNAA